MPRSRRHTKRAVNDRVAPAIIGVPLRIILLIIVIAIAAALAAISVLPIFLGIGAATNTIQARLDAADSTFHRIQFAQSSAMYDSQGGLMTTLHGAQDRTVVQLDQVSQVAQGAVVAIEDHNFYQHGALDATSILRAMVANFAAGHVTQGGSTITQQLVKNAEIGSDAQTFQRKFQEAALATRMEQTYSKSQILGLYLNEVYFGNGIYGIGTASQFYFGKPAGKLKLPEAALLAGVINYPSQYDPIHHPNDAKARRNVVLDQMATYQVITPAQATKAKKAPLGLKVTKAQQKAASKQVLPFFTQYARLQLLNTNNTEFNKALGTTYQQREQSLFEGGLKIYTTYDPKMQDMAQKAADNAPLGSGQDTAIATVQVQSGEGGDEGAVRVLLSGRNYLHDQLDLVAPEQGQHHTTIGIRQPGSSFKPFTLVAALREGISPSTTFSSASPFHSAQWPNACHCVFNAEPFSNGGTIDLNQATAYSVNVVFAQLILQTGIPPVITAAKDAGITTDLAPVYSVTLGADPVSPLEMASAYSTLAREGVHCSPYFIQKIVGPGGPHDILYKHKSDCAKAIAPDIANTVTQMLQGVITQPGATGTAANLGGRPVAGKTGTSENSADLWFVGYVPQYSTAVWVGHPGGPVPQPNEFGGTMAAPIWHNYMLDLLRGVPNENFGQAGHIKTKQGDVPDVTGMTQADAEQALQKAGFTSQAQTADDKSAKGTVFKQSPNGGSQAAQGSSVTIFVSTGKAPASQSLAIPDETGQDEATASAALQKAGFNVNVNHVDSTKPRGEVVGQDPSGGSKGAKGDTVTISVSTGQSGPKQVSVPNEVGQDVGSATNDLQGAGFKVHVNFQQVPHPGKDGIVLGQTPTGKADQGSTVTLTVGKF